ncbi:MAG: 23S rRNA (uracil(1939)-C(5))-methyltransferase RlmD [Candidatus Izemoplasmatales bacterium]|nr:23S rRNA (uracil(1939)-C(5))-methyltransferase RlmD [Candidatus Izemoplasmatales bacterium]
MYTLSVGDKIKLDIRKQGINGEGIGYFNKLAIFVPGAILKEKVDCEILEVKQTYAIARLDGIERVSTRRVTPPCKFYDRCGGCQLQHIDQNEQMKIKQSILKQSLIRYTDIHPIDPLLKRTLGMKSQYGYRNKSQMPFANLNFGLSLGLYEPQSNKFVFVDECLVQHPFVNKVNAKALSLCRKYKMAAADQTNPNGNLLVLVTRYLENTDQCSVTFIVTKYDERLQSIAKELKETYPPIQSIGYSVSKHHHRSVFGKEVVTLVGDDVIYDEVDGLKIRISPDAFHQLNSKQMDILYKEVVKAANLQGNEVVIDGYSGIGVTTLMLAKKAKKVYGIDYSEPSIQDAIANAKMNGIRNVEMLADHVEGAIPRLLKMGVKPDVIVVDPPRAGLEDNLLQEILKAAPKRIVYVSCNPSTLAKNLAVLLPQYEVKSIQPIDMFPLTSSVESVTLLTLRVGV